MPVKRIQFSTNTGKSSHLGMQIRIGGYPLDKPTECIIPRSKLRNTAAMAQLVRLGKYLVEIDGTQLAFFDATGNLQGQPQDISTQGQLTLPDGTAMPIEQLAELLASNPSALANFQTAAGAPDATGQGNSEIDSGGGRFAAFDDQQGIGGLNAIGGLQQNDLQYHDPLERPSRFDECQDQQGQAPGSVFSSANEQVRRLQRQGSEREGNALSVTMELQADCFAGVWGYHAKRERNLIEPGDFEAGLNAAAAIGDDRLQKMGQAMSNRKVGRTGPPNSG